MNRSYVNVSCTRKKARMRATRNPLFDEPEDVEAGGARRFRSDPDARAAARDEGDRRVSRRHVHVVALVGAVVGALLGVLIMGTTRVIQCGP